MTDKEIIKALECCFSTNFDNCGDCSFKNHLDEVFSCIRLKQKFAIDLINRQKAEIEKLSECIVTLDDRLKEKDKAIEFATKEFVVDSKRTKAEAIKEFAERLKEKAMQKYDWNEYIEVEEIDNLVKEMVGDTK